MAFGQYKIETYKTLFYISGWGWSEAFKKVRLEKVPLSRFTLRVFPGQTDKHQWTCLGIHPRNSLSSSPTSA